MRENPIQKSAYPLFHSDDHRKLFEEPDEAVRIYNAR
jgi:hypothetical protein